MQRNLAITNYRVLSSNVTNCQLTLLAHHPKFNILLACIYIYLLLLSCIGKRVFVYLITHEYICLVLCASTWYCEISNVVKYLPHCSMDFFPFLSFYWLHSYKCMFICHFCFHLITGFVCSVVSIAFIYYTVLYAHLSVLLSITTLKDIWSCVSIAFTYFTVLYAPVSVLLSLTSQIDMIMSMLLSITTLLCMLLCQCCFHLLHCYVCSCVSVVFTYYTNRYDHFSVAFTNYTLMYV